MVRLSGFQGKVLRRLKEQAGVKQVPKSKPSAVVGKPVYLYVEPKNPSTSHQPSHTCRNARPAQLNTPTDLPKEKNLTHHLGRPQFRVALIRTPNLSSKYAQFQVPLNFNKFDLRSYLYNLYGVGVLGIRSYVQAQGITRITRDGKGYGPWRRPKSQKRMTVELKEPFAYPEMPKDLTPYGFPLLNFPSVFQTLFHFQFPTLTSMTI
jgi:large subunit ribosomal protein L23